MKKYKTHSMFDVAVAHGRVRCFKLLEPHSNVERTQKNIITSAALDT